MQRIESITLRNFKFFYGTEEEQPQNKLQLNGNNLLLYGENGSGKSSIYWALYTHLQSCLKEDEDIKKYFDHQHSQNLKNRFANDEDTSGIILEIKDESGRRNVEISDKHIQTNTSSDKTINRIIAGSDFINYKYLSKLYDFRNSEEIDLFPLFEREVLMFIDFEESYTDNNGNLSTSTLASDWWQFICNAPKSLPKNARNINTPNQSTEEYKRYKHTTIPKFIENLKKSLQQITVDANIILKERFEEDYQIDFCLDEIVCDYNKKISQKSRDGIIHYPKIPLKINFIHNQLREDKQKIEKPHTFLNEARLTAIALAIRLAMLELRLYDKNSASLLVLDDLLLSLDMSYRDKVLDIILEKVDEYQILILTHDRAFYNLCKRRIEYKSHNEYKWEFKEMYQSVVKETEIPCPFIPDKKSYLDLAKKYLYEFDYPASANYLRKECERVLKKLLPKNKTIHLSENGEGSKSINLDNLISNFKSFYTNIGGDFSPFEKLKEYKDVLMNPLSHDNIESPIYKQELLNLISIIKKLNLLKTKVFEADSENENPFVLKEVDKDDNEWEYIFYLKENLRIIMDLNEKWLFSNPKCYFHTRKNSTQKTEEENIEKEFKIKEGYDKIRYYLGIKEEREPQSLDNIIFINSESLNRTIKNHFQ